MRIAAGQNGMPSLVGVSDRLTAAQMRATILEGKGQMPAFHQFNGKDVDALVAFLTAADTARWRGRAGRGRGGGADDTSRRDRWSQTGPATTRPGHGRAARAACPRLSGRRRRARSRLSMDGYRRADCRTETAVHDADGVRPQQGHDQVADRAGRRLPVLAGRHDGHGRRGNAEGSVILTSTGLLFVTAADRKIHVYDADNGQGAPLSSRWARSAPGRRRCTS